MDDNCDTPLATSSSRTKVVHQTISVKLEEHKKLFNLAIEKARIDSVGITHYRISSKHIKANLIIDIETEAGTKFITLRGDHIVRNYTNQSLEVAFKKKQEVN